MVTFSWSRSHEFSREGASPLPHGESDTFSPHPEPLGTFGALTLAPSALDVLSPSASFPIQALFRNATLHSPKAKILGQIQIR